MIESFQLANHLLVAMPGLTDPNFAHSVVYICEHHQEGTVGLIINQPLQYHLGFIFDQMNIHATKEKQKRLPVLFGGPVQPERGFVIHRPSGLWRSSLNLKENVTVTTSDDIIKALAEDQGPSDVLITLGYAGWSKEQIDYEVKMNQWLVCPATSELLYEIPFEKRWEMAGQSIGVDMSQLSFQSGNA
ncbi:YqgE/AlgH family protein [Legionella sp. W05-934-2]|jgi:putative transcriptional regulator|uniref:YqgE/AlgH family protein n=1 Tax=Legionella sp. W05-934-2 TaxID=1198649 RepID=UPI003462A6E5